MAHSDVESEVPVRVDPFARSFRVVPLSLELRQTSTQDIRLKAERAGYPLHGRYDYKFWKSSEDGMKVNPPTYSSERFCEGYNISALDFYIVRRRLMQLLYRNDLYLRKRKGKNGPEADFDYAEVEEKIKQHALLQYRNAHPYWKNKMIPEFVTKTAEVMREKKTAVLGANGEPVADQFELVPNHILFSPSWTWGGDLAQQYQRIAHIAINDMTMSIKSFESETKAIKMIRVARILAPKKKTGSGKLELDNADFALCWAEVMKKWRAIPKNSQQDYALAYLNPYWGNELLLITDTKSLVIALKTLRVRGKMQFNFIVSLD